MDTSDAESADNTFIKDALRGLLALNSNVILEKECIILRRDHRLMQGKVKLLSGGICGNEPAHHGYVGAGMLTAAVLGTFTSAPTVANISQALTLLGHNYPLGVLVIANNCVKERLNFRTATERACESGLYVKMVIVSDETCHEKVRQGNTGMILIHKIAGAMSESGYSLDEIHRYCSSYCVNIRTVIISQTFINPVSYINSTVCAKFTPAQICHTLNNLYNSKVKLNSNDCIAILVNNYGEYSKFEEYSCVGSAVQFFKNKCNVVRTYSGTFFSVPNTRGISVTVLRISDQNTVKYLDAPTVAIGWPRSPCSGCGLEEISNYCTVNNDSGFESVVSKCDNSQMGPSISDKSVITVTYVLNCVMDAIIACSKQLDSFHNKRNIGTRLKSGAVVVKTAINKGKVNVKYPSALLQSLASISEQYVGGVLGNLYSVLFSSASKIFQKTERDIVDAYVWFSAFRSGTDAISEYREVKIGDGTMLDSLYAAVNALQENLSADPMKPVDALKRATEAAEEAAEKTVTIKQDFKQNFEDPDPGAHAVGIWMRALYESIRLRF